MQMAFRVGTVLRLFCASSYGLAANPTTQPPADPTVDWLLSEATTQPSAGLSPNVPATQPAVLKNQADDADAPHGTLLLSNGESLSGGITSTADQALRIWDDQKKEYRDIPIKFIRTIEARVVWERDEKEWKFKESGSDIKEYSGKTYPARETSYTITLGSGQQVSGSITAPIYLDATDTRKLFVLHKRDKGEAGQALKDLVYVRKIELGR
jgi:hypothetical protein